MSALDRWDFSGWKGLFWFGVLLAAAGEAESDRQLDEIRRLGT